MPRAAAVLGDSINLLQKRPERCNSSPRPNHDDGGGGICWQVESGRSHEDTRSAAAAEVGELGGANTLLGTGVSASHRLPQNLGGEVNERDAVDGEGRRGGVKRGGSTFTVRCTEEASLAGEEEIV